LGNGVQRTQNVNMPCRATLCVTYRGVTDAEGGRQCAVRLTQLLCTSLRTEPRKQFWIPLLHFTVVIKVPAFAKLRPADRSVDALRDFLACLLFVRSTSKVQDVLELDIFLRILDVCQGVGIGKRTVEYGPSLCDEPPTELLESVRYQPGLPTGG
jgi:hypothetical protein